MPRSPLTFKTIVTRDHVARLQTQTKPLTEDEMLCLYLDREILHQLMAPGAKSARLSNPGAFPLHVLQYMRQLYVDQGMTVRYSPVRNGRHADEPYWVVDMPRDRVPRSSPYDRHYDEYTHRYDYRDEYDHLRSESRSHSIPRAYAKQYRDRRSSDYDHSKLTQTENAGQASVGAPVCDSFANEPMVKADKNVNCSLLNEILNNDEDNEDDGDF